MKHENIWRYFIVGSFITAIPCLIFLQLIRIQTNPDQIQQFKDQGSIYSGEYREFTPPRGLIYDRWGHLLAGNEMVYEVGLDLASVKNPREIALATSLVLGQDFAQMFGTANIPPSEDAVYAVLVQDATQAQVSKLQDMQNEFEKKAEILKTKDAPTLDGLVFTPHLQRTYPEKSLASNIIGFVNKAGRGFFGVEENYNDRLAGKPVKVWWSFDPNNVQQMPDVPEGTSVVLTIDSSIQASMEELIDQEVKATGSDSGTIVVMDPESGEILALATTTRMDLNQYWRYGDIYTDGTPFNPGVSETYEPGSVFKIFTMAAGLDSGVVTLLTEFLDKGFIEIGGTPIYNWNGGAWGPQDMQGCMQHSLNVCLAWVAKQMGPTIFYSYMQKFGIGHITSVEMAGEAAGRLKLPGDSDWYEADLGTNSFGQGVAATPLQMVAGASAIANDGKMMAPHIIRSTITKGFQVDVEKQVVSVPITVETAHILTDMLANSLEVESSDALVDGYRVAGKTGTAEIPTPFGYTTEATNASFVGWGPADDPKFVVYVWLERPKASQWGSVVAAPVFREAVERLVVLMNIPPDRIRMQLLGQ